MEFETLQERCDQKEYGWRMLYCNELYYENPTPKDISCRKENCPALKEDKDGTCKTGQVVQTDGMVEASPAVVEASDEQEGEESSS